MWQLRVQVVLLGSVPDIHCVIPVLSRLFARIGGRNVCKCGPQSDMLAVGQRPFMTASV
jgi:hypothetical protein